MLFKLSMLLLAAAVVDMTTTVQNWQAERKNPTNIKHEPLWKNRIGCVAFGVTPSVTPKHQTVASGLQADVKATSFKPVDVLFAPLSECW